jgi:hypothetical protein
VISAFTEQDMLRDWWSVERSLIEKKAGGLYVLAWNIGETGFGYISSGIIQTYDPAGELIIDNLVYMNPGRPLLGPMKLSIRAEEKNDQTGLVLCQDGYRQGEHWDWYYEAVKGAWPVVLEGLKGYLEGRG